MSSSTDASILQVDQLQALSESILRQHGLSAQDAQDASTILVLADLFGLSTHGVHRLLSYTQRLRLGGIKAQARVVCENLAPALLRVNADNALGPLAGQRALQAAMGVARQTGVALALVHQSNHFGPIAPYCHIAAEQGFASIIASNATLSITPWGGRQTKLGNNPIGMGMPHPGANPIVLDMALSVAARAKIRNAALAGQPIPAGWATDDQGQPTTDAAAALRGFLLPVGGHKGYGLAIMVDLLAGLLSGASYLTRVSSWQDHPERPQDLGHFMVLIDTQRLGDTEWLRQRMLDFSDIVHQTVPARADQPVQLPGEREYARRAAQLQDGIQLPKDLHQQLLALATG